MTAPGPGLISEWARRNGSGAALDQSEPPAEIDLGGLGLEGKHGKDDRKPVTDITLAHWRPQVMLTIRAPGSTGPLLGSGVLIAPDIVLTAAHNVYRLTAKAFVKSITAQIGVFKGTQNGASRGVHVYCPPAYRERGPKDAVRHQYDYAIIRLSDDTLGKWAKTQFDVPSQPPMTSVDLARSALMVAGYPGDVTPLTLMTCYGEVSIPSVTDSTFNYTMDTMPGQSGGPVFRYDSDGTITFAGVHVADGDDSNRACRYSQRMQADIKRWIGEIRGHATLS